MNATFYKFSKNQNSTKRPNSSTPNQVYSININDGNSSILSPQIRLTPVASQTVTNVSEWNYCYIPSFKRYYYVSNWSYNADGTWTADLSVDMLASWKIDIMNSPGYVHRSQSYYDATIPDTLYKSRLAPITIRNNAYTGFFRNAVLFGTGSYILHTVGKTSNVNFGGTGLYLMTPLQFNSLIQNFLGVYDSNGTVIENLYWRVQQNGQFQADSFSSLYSPLQFVVSCRYYPFWIPRNTNPEALTQIQFGGWKAGGQGGILMGRTWEELPYGENYSYVWGEIDLSDIDDENNRHANDSSWTVVNPDDYPSYAPYAQYALQTPWGTWDLDPNYMSIILNRPSPKLYWKIMMDWIHGTGTLVVRDTNSQTLVDSTTVDNAYDFFRQTVNIGVDVPLQGLFENVEHDLSAGKSLGNSLMNIIGGGLSFLGGNYGGIAQGIAGTMNSAFDMVDLLNGGNRIVDGSNQFGKANVTPLLTNITVQQTRYPTVGRSSALYGRPLKMFVNNLLDNPVTPSPSGQERPFAGYIRFEASKFESECTDTEAKNIIEMLKCGVYLE